MACARGLLSGARMKSFFVALALMVGASLNAGCSDGTIGESDGESESEDGHLGALIKQGEQAARDNRDAPAEPDRPAKVAEARSENGHNDGARDEQADCGKEIDACADRRGATHRHPVEGNIVEGCEELDVGQR